MFNKIGTETIKTDRFFLRRFTFNDAEDMFKNWVNDSDVCKFLSWYEHGNIEVTRELLNNWVIAYDDLNTYNWAIELKETKEVIGSISVVQLNEKHCCCEIGYCISKKCWNKGITTDALKAVIRFLFDKVNMNRIAATHDTENPASGKVMEKSGMKFEGTMRQKTRRKDGSWGDMNIWAVVRDDIY